MSSGWLIFLIAVGVVAFFVVGMSLTIIFKGHYMESEIGENRHMKARGIRCASQQLARGGGRVARRFLGGRRGVLRRKLLVLHGRFLRRARARRLPVGRLPARSGNRFAPSVVSLSFRRIFLEGAASPCRSFPYLRRHPFFMKLAGRVVGCGARTESSQRSESYEDIPADQTRGRLLKTKRRGRRRTGCSGGKRRGLRAGTAFYRRVVAGAVPASGSLFRKEDF